jgi:hypothetical protein
MAPGRVSLWRIWVELLTCLILLLATGCAAAPPAPPSPIPPGQARIWFYRTWLPSESLNLANIDVNGVYFGSVAPGGVFYRDVPPGIYHIAPQQFDGPPAAEPNTNVAVVPGQQVYIKILDLSSWANAVSGGQFFVKRDSWYAWLIPPQAAQAEIANPWLVPRPLG